MNNSGKNQQRQGDVFVEQFDAMPANVKPVTPVNGRWVVALGESTGHCHAIEVGPGMEMYEDEQGNYWLKVSESPATLAHVKEGGAIADHKPNLLAPSPKPYRIEPRQFTYHAGIARRVID